MGCVLGSRLDGKAAKQRGPTGPNIFITARAPAAQCTREWTRNAAVRPDGIESPLMRISAAKCGRAPQWHTNDPLKCQIWYVCSGDSTANHIRDISPAQGNWDGAMLSMSFERTSASRVERVAGFRLHLHKSIRKELQGANSELLHVSLKL